MLPFFLVTKNARVWVSPRITKGEGGLKFIKKSINGSDINGLNIKDSHQLFLFKHSLHLKCVIQEIWPFSLDPWL